MPNAENKDQTGAFWLRNLSLSFFMEKKQDSHYENESIYIYIYTHTQTHTHTCNSPACVSSRPRKRIYIYIYIYIYRHTHTHATHQHVSDRVHERVVDTEAKHLIRA